jgi:hypothetical protein
VLSSWDEIQPWLHAGSAVRSTRTNWNTVLLEQIRLAGLPEPLHEYVFHANRNWRFDFCWRYDGLLVACEIEGGSGCRPRPVAARATRPERFEQDCEKYNGPPSMAGRSFASPRHDPRRPGHRLARPGAAV